MKRTSGIVDFATGALAGNFQGVMLQGVRQLKNPRGGAMLRVQRSQLRCQDEGAEELNIGDVVANFERGCVSAQEQSFTEAQLALANFVGHFDLERGGLPG
jgi:hypothetical protein